MRIEKFKKKKVLNKESTCVLISEIDFDLEKKKPINFCLILVLYKGEKIYEIIKYDGSHGYCHIHKYFEKLSAKGEKCLPNMINANSILTHKSDILENWEKYVEKFRQKWKI